MRYPKHLFLTYGSYQPHWWTIEDKEEELNCSVEDRAEVLQFSLAAHNALTSLSHDHEEPIKSVSENMLTHN